MCRLRGCIHSYSLSATQNTGVRVNAAHAPYTGAAAGVGVEVKRSPAHARPRKEKHKRSYHQETLWTRAIRALDDCTTQRILGNNVGPALAPRGRGGR